jgi:hypothetical protein
MLTIIMSAIATGIFDFPSLCTEPGNDVRTIPSLMSLTDTGENIHLEVTEIGHNRHTHLKCLQILHGSTPYQISKPCPSNGIHHSISIQFVVAFEVTDVDHLPELRRLEHPPPTEGLTPLSEFHLHGIVDDRVRSVSHVSHSVFAFNVVV